MRTIKTVEVIPVFVEFVPKELEDNKIYISKKYDFAVHLCLCGCKNKTITPLNHGDGIFKDHGWNLIENNGKVSLTPSIGNYQLPCQSHYIITNNKANFI